jgi:hypothetical protein
MEFRLNNQIIQELLAAEFQPEPPDILGAVAAGIQAEQSKTLGASIQVK